MILLTCIKQRQATFEAQFMNKLSNTEAELKKSVAYKKSVELKMEIKKNHTHVKKMGHTSKFLCGIYS